MMKTYTDIGIKGFWNDMNEPTVFGQQGDTFPDVVQHEWEGYGAEHREAHNAYGMQMARATAEGLRVHARSALLTSNAWTPPTLVGRKLFRNIPVK